MMRKGSKGESMYSRGADRVGSARRPWPRAREARHRPNTAAREAIDLRADEVARLDEELERRVDAARSSFRW